MTKLKIKQAKALCSDFFAYIKHKKFIPQKSEKAIFVNFKNPQLYHRFFYTLLKFYNLAGYNVYFPLDFSTYRNLRNKDRYLRLLVWETNTICINKNMIPENCIEINDEMFKHNYFEAYFKNNNDTKNAFHVPMSFHPFMYHLNFWNDKIELKKTRHNAIFCYGNFDEKEYLEIKNTYFKSLSRTELHDFFKKQKNYISLEGKKDLLTQNINFDKKFVFSIKEKYTIKMQDVRPHLALFNFFLCCSGVVKPICHNVIEAMSVGTIPVIEKEYAEILYPNLEHKKNAMIFNDLEHLHSILDNEIFTFSPQEIQNMRENVFTYYNDNLSPEGMIKNLNEAILAEKNIYLQAGPRSVKFKAQKDEFFTKSI